MTERKKILGIGLVLLISFALTFWGMMHPFFTDMNGKKLTGLQYADITFNELAKGSSYFIPAVIQTIREMKDIEINMTVKLKDAELASAAAAVIEKSGIQQVSLENNSISFCGKLADLLLSAAVDSDYLYKNEGEAISSKYEGEQPLKIAQAWWQLLSPCVKTLQVQHQIEQAKVVDLVIRKAIEPGNNFYGIVPARVSDHIFLVTALLVFYVFYSLWYGFSIYYIFEGLGLMGAAKGH